MAAKEPERTAEGKEMGLDATVFCDCFERGLLKTPPPSGCRVIVGKNGGRECDDENDLDLLFAFDRWEQTQACEHEGGCLVTHYIGNIGLVAALRNELNRMPERFPLILSRVIYNGIHDGFIPAADVGKLIPELEALAHVHCSDPEMEPYLRHFQVQMEELVSASLRVRKPIAF